MSSSDGIRIGGKSYEAIVDTAKRYDKDKEKPVVTTSVVDKQRRKVDNLMARIDKPINIAARPKDWKPADPKEFVRNVMGSSAGAGSGEFHVYRAIRKRTMQREEYLSKEKEKLDVQKGFEKRLVENREKEDAKTAKKRLKRQKRKANKKKPRTATVTVESSESESEEENVVDSGNADDRNTDKNNESSEQEYTVAKDRGKDNNVQTVSDPVNECEEQKQTDESESSEQKLDQQL